MTNHNLRRAVRLALFAAGTASAGIYASGAVAQGEPVEQIIVTGSRIATTGLESPSPLTIVGAEEIDSSGVVNIQDLLLQNPAFGTPTLSRTNSNFLTSSVGVATVDLRNLGVERTLVLVNGRRFVAGIPGESAVDLNAIPQQFIERVEVLTGGASSVYGSDAVAGVVNIIYKKDFEGIELGGQYGASSESDDRQTQFNLTMGTSTDDGRGRIMAHAGYTDQGEVLSRNRERSAVDQISRALLTGDPADMFIAERPFFSSFAPQGRFFTGDTQFTFDGSNNLVEGWSTNGNDTTPARGFNRSQFRTIAVPVERYLFATQGDYEFAEGHRVFMEGTYASAQAISVLEPFPLASDDIYGGTGGQVPAEFETFTPDPIIPGNFIRNVVRNPLIPQTMFDAMADSDGDGLRDYYFTRRMAELGTRGNVVDRDTFRVVGGFQGEIPVLDGWDYEAYYAYGQTKEAQTSSGQVNVLNFRNALEAIPDVNDLDGDGSTTDAICRDATARDQGCVPVSVFGFGAISAAAADYIKAPGQLTTFTQQKVAGLNFTGSVFDLPAGPLGLAIGAEYRDEYSRSEFDALQQAGLNAGNAIPRTEGSFDVIESYIEANVPILADLPFADQLNLRAAYRYADYETVGNTDSWNVGLEWAPIPQVRFRGIRALSTRAPNINELHSPPSQTFPPGLIDPCTGVTLTSAGTKDDNCRATPGVIDNINANGGVFVQTQADLQGISGFDRGNPLLGEEEGKSWTVGVVIQPDNIAVLENFAFTIDYSEIDIEQAIVDTPRQFILDQCYGNGALCEFITRRPQAQGANSAGSIDEIDSGPTNSGGFFAEGIDLGITYAQQLGPGNFNARLLYTHALDGYLRPLPDSPQDPFVGEVGGSEDRFNLGLGYDIGDFGFTWRTTYIGSAALDDQFLAQFDLAPESIKVDSVMYHDVQVNWSPGDTYEVYLGATNLFDEDPPPIITGLPEGDTGTETDAGTYDAIGQRIYGGVRVRF